MLRFTRALINLSPRISPRYFCTVNDPVAESLDASIFFDRPKLKSINCLILHPVLFPNKGPETELYLAEEAIGLAKALNWNIIKGPYWQDKLKTSEIIISEDETNSDDESDLEEVRGRGRNTRRAPREGDYVYADVFKGVYQGGAILLDLWSSEDEEDALYNEWKNQLLRKSIAKSSLLKVRSTSNNTYFTKGKVEQLGNFIARQDINAVFINSELTALQVRNLEKQWNFMINQYLTKKNKGTIDEDDGEKVIKVFDRFTMILQIFAKRARSRVAKLQIELAFLNFMKTKLMRQGSTFSGVYNIFDADLAKAQEVKLEVVSSKQRGGTGKLSGQGETQLEVEKRLIADKEAKIRKELISEANLRQRLRIKRKENTSAVPTIALIGYTNAGKSALMNRLTNAGVESEDRLFQTLSTTSKKIKLKSGQMGILLDTIGFITNLPHDLIESFSCTLEEVQDADLVLHIRDINHPHTEDQKKTVLKVLRDLGFDETFYTRKMIEVWNKIDLLDEDINQEVINNSEIPIIPISALDGTGCGQLVNTITTRVNELMGKMTFKFVHSPEKHQERLNWLYKNANIANVENFNYNQKPTKEYPSGKITFELAIDEVTFKKYESHFGMRNEKLEKSKKDEIPEEWLKGSKSFFDKKKEEANKKSPNKK